MTRESVADTLPVRPHRVLLVDDSMATAALERILTTLGHHTISVTRGSIAIPTYRSFDPDAIVIDLGLPDMDGCEVARQLIAQARRRRPLLIALTGWDRPEDFARTASAGFHRHLVKPCSVSKLEQVIASRAIASTCRRRTDPQPVSSSICTPAHGE